jgi:tetratricopeptide (TPR) repeat protein
MTLTQEPRSPRFRRRRSLLLAAILFGTVAAGAALYFGHFRPAPPPTPPDAEPDENDPAVATAVRIARDRVLKQPTSAQAWGDLGEAFLANELEEKSKVCFARAEHLDPANPRWPYFQSAPLLNQGDRPGALPYLRRAAELCDARQESTSTPRLLLAETLLALGQLNEAEAEFASVLGREPDSVRAHFGMGLLASAREDWEASRGHLLRCLGNPQARRKASIQLTAVSQRRGDEDSADKFRAQADRLPKDIDWVDPYVAEYLTWAVKKRVRYRLVEQFEAAGRSADAVAVLQPMAEEYPDDYLPHLTLGKALGQTGNYLRAERALRRARQLAPDKAQVHYYLSLILMMEGQEASRQQDSERARKLWREAVDEAREALAITPDNGFAHMSEGLSHKYLGARVEAVAALRRAVHCNPELPELHFYLGEMLAEDGQDAEARNHLHEALESGPADAPWRSSAAARLAALKKDGPPTKEGR